MTVAVSLQNFWIFHAGPCPVGENRDHFWGQTALADGAGLDLCWAGASFVQDYCHVLKIVEYHVIEYAV